jgi:hypothetical protein
MSSKRQNRATIDLRTNTSKSGALEKNGVERDENDLVAAECGQEVYAEKPAFLGLLSGLGRARRKFSD